MADQPTIPSGDTQPPEWLRDLAEALAPKLVEMATMSSSPAGAPKPPVVPPETGEPQSAPLPLPVCLRPTHRLASRKFWVAVGTVATLIAQKPAGLDLSPAALVAVAAVAAIYVAAQAIVDSAQKQGGGNG